MRTVGLVVYWLIALKVSALGAFYAGLAFMRAGEYQDQSALWICAAFVFVMAVWGVAVPLKRRLFDRPRVAN